MEVYHLRTVLLRNVLYSDEAKMRHATQRSPMKGAPRIIRDNFMDYKNGLWYLLGADVKTPRELWPICPFRSESVQQADRLVYRFLNKNRLDDLHRRRLSHQKTQRTNPTSVRGESPPLASSGRLYGNRVRRGSRTSMVKMAVANDVQY